VQIAYEGPKNIAAIFMESITGTNGVLKPPRGYLEAVRDICTEHGILVCLDEHPTTGIELDVD
jgi:taurine---2-oxoglutarate transaminase